jgi:hypothetical protein
LSGG